MDTHIDFFAVISKADRIKNTAPAQFAGYHYQIEKGAAVVKVFEFSQIFGFKNDAYKTDK